MSSEQLLRNTLGTGLSLLVECWLALKPTVGLRSFATNGVGTAA